MKKSFLALLLMLCTGAAFSQTVYNSSGRTGNRKSQKERGFDPDRLVFGGGLGASFGTYTAVSVSPVIGYRFTDWLAAGVGVGYQYLRVRDAFELYNASTNDYDYYPYKASLF